MTATPPPSDAVAWVSTDGTSWSHAPAGTVTKIVIGTPPKPGDDAKLVSLDGEVLGKLPELLASPILTHLHLWQIYNLATTLTQLPGKLQVLDVRGCPDLTTLPALPVTLETLDVGQCPRLGSLPTAPPLLARLYANDCTGLSDLRLRGFLDGLAPTPLVELNLSQTVLTTIAEVPGKHLQKLVLAECTKLTDVAGFEAFSSLRHLNLSGCAVLETLPALPPAVNYLLLHGAEKLGTFMAQSIGPYDRGKKDENVAQAFHTRRKFGTELAVMPHAKLLLMGDGRVGKSTLAKRLRYQDTQAIEDKPDEDEAFTHRVRFWKWNTALALAEKEMVSIEGHAQSAGIGLPKNSKGLLEGAIRLWDFGGQEIYHSTHRIFAGEGSIFLLVWREKEPEPGTAPEDVTPEEWKEWNRQRPLDYWLDYIYSMRPGAQVAVVCTKCVKPDDLKNKPDWKARAPKHAYRDLPAFWVDSLDEECGQHREYQRLETWIREACGREALRIGIIQPRFFREVSELLDCWMDNNSTARREDAAPEHLMVSWNHWEAEVIKAHGGRAAAIDTKDVETITSYLHAAGQLFHVRQEGHAAVLVDQEWAADLIYRLLQCGSQLRRTTKLNGGWFYHADLEQDPLWQTLHEDLQRERLISYMLECRVITRLSSGEENRLGKEIFLASDKWLLPKYDQVAHQVDLQMQMVKDKGAAEQEKFEFESLEVSEFDFRSLQSLLARTFGIRAVYFRDGFQALDEDGRWCFRCRWEAKEGDVFEGKIDAVLLAPRLEIEKFAEQLEDLFFAEGGPLSNRRCTPKRSPAREADLAHEFFRGVKREIYDVAISSSGVDKTEAEAMVRALRAAGISATHYLLPDCRVGDQAGVLNFMHSLSRPPCIVLVLSSGYLRDSPETNWYCLWELADAVRQLGDGRRSAAQTIAVYRPGGGLDSKTLNEVIVPLFNAAGSFMADAYGNIPFRDRQNFRYYDEFSLHFAQALDGDKCQKFFKARGTLGSYLKMPADVEVAGAFEALINVVKEALSQKKVNH